MLDRFSAPQLSFRTLPALLVLAALALLNTGCESNFVTTATGRNPSIQAATMYGKVFGGQQPIAGATVPAL